MGAANTNRASVGYIIRNKMQKYEWFSLIGLLTSVVFIVFYIKRSKKRIGIQ